VICHENMYAYVHLVHNMRPPCKAFGGWHGMAKILEDSLLAIQRTRSLCVQHLLLAYFRGVLSQTLLSYLVFSPLLRRSSGGILFPFRGNISPSKTFHAPPCRLLELGSVSMRPG